MMGTKTIKRSIQLVLIALLIGPANALYAQNPLTMEWWEGLSRDWQACFVNELGLEDQPVGSEQLDDIYALTKINCAGIDDFGESRNINTLEPIEQLVNLEAVDCSYSFIKDLSSLTKLPKLRELNIGYTNVKDLSPIASAANLRKLTCSGLKINNLEEIANLTQLEELDLFETEMKDGYQSVAAFVNLKSLSVDDTQILDLAPISGLKNLEKLAFSNTKITDISPVSSLKNLKSLVMSNTKVTDLAPLKKLKQLVYLNINENKVSDLSSLKKLKKMEVMYFSNTLVGDLQPLAKMKSLKEITLSQTKVTTLDHLAGMKLKVIIFTDTGIFTLKPLESVNSLNVMYCRDSKIPVEEIRAFQQRNPDCETDYY